jgi:hypothetical protein
VPALLLCLLALVDPDPRAQLLEARHRFEQGDYPATRALLRPLIDREVFTDAADRNQALRLYGVAALLEGRTGEAEGALTALLAHDPAARLDPALYPPEVVAFFDAIRARRQAELARAAERARGRKHLLLAVLPFGVGQFQNHQPRKGYALLALELALVAGAAATFAAFQSAQQPGATFADNGDARALKNANLGCWAALGAAWLYGVSDALYYYRKDGVLPSVAPVPGGIALSVAWGF